MKLVDVYLHFLKADSKFLGVGCWRLRRLKCGIDREVVDGRRPVTRREMEEEKIE